MKTVHVLEEEVAAEFFWCNKEGWGKHAKAKIAAVIEHKEAIEADLV